MVGPSPRGQTQARARAWPPWLASVAVTAAAFAVRLALDGVLATVQPYAFFYLSVACAAWLGGVGPGALSAVLGLVLGTVVFYRPVLTGSLLEVVPLLVYGAVCACIVALVAHARGTAAAAGETARRLREEQQASRARMARLRESEQRVRQLLDSSVEGIYGLDAAGRCTFVNAAGLRLLGYTDARELVGRPMHERIHHTRRDGSLYPEEECSISRAWRYGEHVLLREEPLWRRDGTSFPADYAAHPVVQDGRVVGAMVTFLDVTERGRTERALAESELRFAQAFADAPVGMALVALDGTLQGVNRAYCALTGYDEAELRGRRFQDLTHPDDLGQNVDAVERLIAGEIPAFFVEKRYIRKDGRVVWVRASASLRRDAEGRPLQIVGIVEDVDERRRAEAALAQATTLLAAISDSTGDAIFAKDRGGRLTFANPATLALVGRPEHEVLGRTDAEILRDADAARQVMENDRRIMETGVAEDVEEVVPLPDGTPRVWYSRKVPYRDPDGRVIGILGTSRDITDRKAAEDALRDTIAALEASEAARAYASAQLAEHAANLERTVAERTGQLTETVHELEAFSYSLSHDMRAPLRAMKGFSQILEAEHGPALGEDGRMYLGRISRAAGRLDQLIQDVLTYSRIVQEPIELEAVDLDRLVRALVDENPALQPPRADITVASPLRPVLGHEAYLMQVLSNLVYNAVKFARPGATPHVRIWTEEAGDRVRLFVEDDGIGIEPEALHRIFGMFQRVHGGHADEGTGIGLAIVRKAVERMGGHVGVTSEPGRGSTFQVELRRPRGAP